MEVESTRTHRQWMLTARNGLFAICIHEGLRARISPKTFLCSSYSIPVDIHLPSSFARNFSAIVYSERTRLTSCCRQEEALPRAKHVFMRHLSLSRSCVHTSLAARNRLSPIATRKLRVLRFHDECVRSRTMQYPCGLYYPPVTTCAVFDPRGRDLARRELCNVIDRTHGRSRCYCHVDRVVNFASVASSARTV